MIDVEVMDPTKDKEEEKIRPLEGALEKIHYFRFLNTKGTLKISEVLNGRR